MRINHPSTGVEAWVRDPRHSDLAIVIGDLLDQPVDGVVGVRTLIDLLRRLLGEMRSHVDKLTFRHPPPSHVLVNEDVAGFAELGRRSQIISVLVNAVRLHVVRRSRHQKRIRPTRILRNVDRREQPFPVTHRNPVFVLRVMCFDMLNSLSQHVVFSKRRTERQRHSDNGSDNEFSSKRRMHEGLPRGNFSLTSIAVWKANCRNNTACNLQSHVLSNFVV